MSIYLMGFASDWKGGGVPCHFKTSADGVLLTPRADTDDTQPFYLIPNGASEVILTATPQASPSPFWDNTVTLTVGASGLTAKSGSEGFVKFKTLQSPLGDIGVNATVVLSRFKDFTPDTIKLLQSPPSTRNGQPFDEVKDHRGFWETWPPTDWGLVDLKSIPFIDAAAPVKSGALNFVQSDLAIHATHVVLRLAGVDAPQLFAVTWPDSIKPAPGSTPTPAPFLIFLEQTLQTNFRGSGRFVGGELAAPDKAYPNNFDYADMLYQQVHYEDDAPFSWMVAKGVPYQVAKAGANVVTVVPLNSYDKEYGVIMTDTEELGKILEELQAFMFMTAKVPNPPTSVGRTALAAFSSATHVLHKWLESSANCSGNFLKNIVKAVYFLDPPLQLDPALKDYDVNTYMASARGWAGNPRTTDKRIRLYMRDHSDAHGLLLGSYDDAQAKMLPKTPPSKPYVQDSADGLRTAAELPQKYWVAPALKFGGLNIPVAYQFNFAHHMFAATMLTHALTTHPPTHNDLS